MEYSKVAPLSQVQKTMPASVRLLIVHKLSVCGGNVAPSGVFHKRLHDGGLKGCVVSALSKYRVA